MRRRFGPYEVLRPLSTSGMGNRFIGRPVGVKDVDRVVVIKELPAQLSGHEQVVHAFLETARLAAALDHPKIARVCDRGREGESCYFATEYIHGVDCRHLLEQARVTRRPLPLGLSIAIGLAACEALKYAHELSDAAGWPLGVIHGYISPTTVMVGFDGRIKVVDFGNPPDRITDKRLGLSPGRAASMSPE